ncbi:hypothetical protein [Burkholderia ubonensis]|uniref:hypothetical protein n=1 Tax=Burkholderia ubonensis TaxID=101571 RepID=UPI000758AE76|nr:hypothetical protein [Burkholderia ubonensis]KVP75553.1 hypothetical protein WJ93_09345 [Burkholderia ubonensis]
MKLKTIALAMLLSAGGAYAAPALQTCSPMEVTHNGGAGLSYILACNAGDWSMTYTGSVPAGTDSVLARYRVQVSNLDGSNFSQTRSVRLPSPAMLGQALLREAVVLDNGDLALRDCPEFSCTLYRPLGSAEKLAKATITVTPEIKRLTDEVARLNAELAKRQAEVTTQNGKVASLEKNVRELTAKLGGAEQSLTAAKAALDAAKEQYNADIAGLLDSSKADLTKATEAAGVQLTAQVVAANNALEKARADLAKCMAEHQAAEDAKAKADAEVEARGKMVDRLQAVVSSANEKLTAAQAWYDAQVADLNSKQAQAIAEQSANFATMRLKLDAANGEVETLTANVKALEGALAGANQQLQAAQKSQAVHDAALGAAADNKDKHYAALESALADAQKTIGELTSARAAQVGELQASLDEANKKLSAAQSQFDAQMVELTGKQAQQTLSTAEQGAELAAAQAKLAAATAEVDHLTQKVAGLEQALADAKKAKDGGDAALKKLSVATPESQAADHAQLEKLTAERDAATAEVTQLKDQLAAILPKMEKLSAERDDALRGAQQVAKAMLEALDQFQALQEAKDEADKALASTTNKLMDLSAKLEAANLARELAMQAATTAHADADTQNLKNEELAQQLGRAKEQLKALVTERYDLNAKLEAATTELRAVRELQGAGTSDVDTLKSAVSVLVNERDQLQAHADSQKQRIGDLEQVNSEQVNELARLRAELAALKGHVPQNVPTPPAPFADTR